MKRFKDLDLRAILFYLSVVLGALGYLILCSFL